jgi:hypothetical protein
MIAKIKAPSPKLGAGRQLEITRRQQMICFLVGDDEDDVVGGLGRAGDFNGLSQRVRRGAKDN